MLSQKWQTSERKYRVREERDFNIPVGDGAKLNSYVFRPDAAGQFPAILGVCAYSLDDQIAPVMPVGTGGIRGHMEAGDPNFYVSRGYVHVIMNVRGTGKSEGFYDFLGRREIQDIYDAIEWLAIQPWCNGKVGMFGPSYFTMVQKRVAALNPPSLKCVFAMYGLTDLYRDLDYHGGILHHNFRTRWIAKLANLRFKNRMKEKLGEEEYRRRVQAALSDAEIAAIPPLVEALREPDKGRNAWIVEPLLFPQYSEFWQEWHEATHGDLKIPAYLGSCWGVYGIHLAGDMRSWEQWQGPKKFTVGPPIYLDRPIYQYHYGARILGQRTSDRLHRFTLRARQRDFSHAGDGRDNRHLRSDGPDALCFDNRYGSFVVRAVAGNRSRGRGASADARLAQRFAAAHRSKPLQALVAVSHS